MQTYRYTLQPYKGPNTRYRCPACGVKGKFSRYIDTKTGEHIAPEVGRCDRENNCGYHLKPKEYFAQHGKPMEEKTFRKAGRLQQILQTRPVKPRIKQTTPPVQKNVFEIRLSTGLDNNFVKYLHQVFGQATTLQLIKRYNIGSSNQWPGATVFWQVDATGNTRTGKIMLYNAITGKRIKEPFSYIAWAHTALHKPAFALQQCLFGDHLLRSNTQPVAIVESEKTAIIASALMPRFTWLATGGLSNLDAQRCAVLKGRKVILFPDLGGFEKWKQKATELKAITDFKVSHLLETAANANDRQQGLDLADFLLRKNKQPLSRPKGRKEIEARFKVLFPEPDWGPITWERATPKAPEPPLWNKEIAALETFFANHPLPTAGVKLNSCTTISNVQRFVQTHLGYVKAQNGNRCYLPYLERLQELHHMLLKNTKSNLDLSPERASFVNTG